MKSPLKRIMVLHPFLFVLYAIFALYANNLSQTEISQVVRPLVISVGLVGVLFLFWGFLLRDWHRAGLICALTALLFFSFGHIYSLLYNSGTFAMPANVLAAIWAAAAILGTWAIARLLKRFSRKGTLILNVVSGAALLLCCTNAAAYSIRNAVSTHKQGAVSGVPAILPSDSLAQIPNTSSGAQAEMPDIYYLILDGYGRSDVLREVYGVDNSGFIDYLQSRGFYVADESQTNYPLTALSLSSSLNHDYLNNLVSIDPGSDSLAPLQDLVRDSAVIRFLKQRGYRIVAFASGYSITEMPEADLYYPAINPLSPFEEMLLNSTVAIFWNNQNRFQRIRENYLHAFSELKKTAQLEGPKFVFVHVTMPHPPFIFDQDGSLSKFGGTGEGLSFSGSHSDHLNGYRGQVVYIDQVYEQIIDSLLKNSKTPPVILLQGDHGPGAYLDLTSLENTCLGERMPILNAYYLPGEKTEELYPTISPVNSFRVVFNEYFDQDLPLLPDRQFFALWETPYQWTDVTGKTNEACPAWTGEVIR